MATIDTDAATETLAKMGVGRGDMPDAIEATRGLVRRYGPGRQDEAAEFVGSVMAITGIHGLAIRLIPNLMDFAERLARA